MEGCYIQRVRALYVVLDVICALISQYYSLLLDMSKCLRHYEIIGKFGIKRRQQRQHIYNIAGVVICVCVSHICDS